MTWKPKKAIAGWGLMEWWAKTYFNIPDEDLESIRDFLGERETLGENWGKFMEQLRLRGYIPTPQAISDAEEKKMLQQQVEAQATELGLFDQKNEMIEHLTKQLLSKYDLEAQIARREEVVNKMKAETAEEKLQVQKEREKLAEDRREVQEWSEKVANRVFIAPRQSKEELEEEAKMVEAAKPTIVHESLEDKLRDKFLGMLISEVGLKPSTARGYLPAFRLRMSEENPDTFEKGEKLVDDLLEEIRFREIKKPVKAPRAEVYRPGKEKLGIPVDFGEFGMPEEFVTKKVEPPKAPLSTLPFVRAPSSEEKTVLWEAFKSRLEREGVDAYKWVNLFNDRIATWPVRYWGELLKNFEDAVEDALAGRTARLIWRPYMPWREDKMPEDAIVHFASIGGSLVGPNQYLYPTMEELIDALARWGVLDITPEKVAEVIKTAWKSDDPQWRNWLLTTPKEYLAGLLGIPPEQL